MWHCRYYGVGLIGFYIWHTLAHSEWAGEMHEIHMEHHLERFPPSVMVDPTRSTTASIAKVLVWLC